MSSTIAAQNDKLGHHNNESAIPLVSNLPIVNDGNMEVEEEDEEDEDVDFNPFLRGNSPSEASSSLSSENEGPGDNVDRNFRSSSNGKDDGASLRQPEETRGCEGEETVMQAIAHGKEGFSGSPTEKETSSPSQQGDGLACGEGSNKDMSSRNGNDGANCLTRDETSQRPILKIDDEDAICKRTRARHSLANYTLEELETFLQESDDDGDLPNVDDEEEYRKFLAAVLAEGVDDGKEGQGYENIDEDEDNDVDFELEIEEALESDVDENVDYNRRKDGKQDGDAHMPVTRQKKRLKESAKNKKNLFGQAKMPLRPLMPYESTTKASALPAHGRQCSSPIVFPYCSSSTSGAYLITGFTAHQIGQLHCLIHEHVQLLIQVFSVSVLDPSKQEVSSEVQKMISEMICKREEALGHRKVPYPEFCFHPPNLQSSLLFDFNQAANSSFWTPSIINPVLSILDVAPLRLVKSFMTDVSDTVMRYRQSRVEDVSDKSYLIREPLFPLPELESSSTADKDSSGGTTTMYSNTHTFPQVSPGQPHPKKSLASVLVESTKKQSVALVPKDIAKSAKKFYPLFNAALFPHKPPAPAVANRVLFTDAEDGLLAMGIMQYNNDWAAIQQHFLPCKSTHQIFVRQKNRSSSKAPENPIKAVRRMKTSPLTTDEKAHIYEGIKLFKNDWLSVWKFIVPHRDPSLLPRLWRIATGTQKSYKKSEAMKEKRRLYDAKRRKMKASVDDCQTSSDNEVDNGGDNSAGDADGEEEAYVHEAFLADSEPRSSRHVSSDAPILSIGRSNMQSVNIMPHNGSTCIRETCTSTANGSGDIRQESGHRFQNSSLLHPPPHYSQIINSASSKQLPYNSISRASNSQLVSQPCQTHKSKGSRVVKLAPDLPPVNLPPSVRVISQSAFKNYHSELLAPASSDTAVKDNVPRFSHSARVGSGILNPGEQLNKICDDGLDTSRQHDGGTCASQFGAEENTSESDLRMHPLLFQAPESQFSSYFSINFHGTGSTIQKSFQRNPLQADPNLPRCHSSVRPDFSRNITEQPEKAPSDLCTIDFHPLLQRADSENGDSAPRASLYQLSGDLRDSQVNSNKFFDQSDCISRIPMLGDNQVATSTASLTHNEKVNNLDLDIRLCSAPDKERTSGRELHNVKETRTVLEHRMVGNNLHGDASFLNHSGRFPEVSTTSQLSLQFVPPSNSSEYKCTGDLHDDSLPGIVMEQEELSDSEEEIEPVEFEREEIDDSEEDEMGNELPTGIQNKEFSFFTSKEDEIQANQPLRSTYLMNGAVQKCEKSKHGSAKKNRSCSSPPDVQRSLPGRSSMKRGSDSPKMHPLQTVQCKAAATTRKPRKQSLRAGPSCSSV